MDESFGADEKVFALFTVVAALARTLSESDVLDRSRWLEELTGARSWLESHGEDGALAAFDSMVPMLSDI